MCTAVFYGEYGIFGRTLDLERSFGECIVRVPRGYPVSYRRLRGEGQHASFIGTAHIADGYPLLYDGMNEHGVAAAALNFPNYAKYRAAERGRINLCSFEVLPYVLSRAESLADARELLRGVNITDDVFSDSLPATPLHYIVASAEGSLVIEQGEGGFRVFENPFGALTNAPSFDYQITRLSDFCALGSSRGENRLAPDAPLPSYSRGMGAIGLPGDFSSSSRFVRAVYAKNNTSPTVFGDVRSAVSAFFHIMETVSVPSGCILTDTGESVRTVYTSAMDLGRRIYYFRGYDTERIFSVGLEREEGDALERFDIPRFTEPVSLS